MRTQLLAILMCAAFLVCDARAILADELLIFSAQWCGPCKQLKAALEKEPDIVAGFDVTIIDVDADPKTTRKYRVQSMPTLIIVKEDGTMRRKVGFTGVADLRRWLSHNEQYQDNRQRFRLFPWRN